MGTSEETGDGVSFSPKDLSTHAYILGSTGCGKTSLILKLLEQDIKGGHSVVVVDLRGDLVDGALSLCESLNLPPERVTLLDLREKLKVVGFNPLAGAGEPYIRALHLLDVIAAESESWGVQLEESLRNALLLLAYSSEPITKLDRLLSDSVFRRRCLSACSDDALVTFWERFEDMSPDKQLAWSQPVLNKVTPLMAVPSLRQFLSGKPGIDLGQVLSRRGQVLLVSLAVDELHRSSRMVGSLLIAAISREMMARVNLPQPKRNPVRLYVDEFENMASDSFEGLISEGRRFNLSLVLAHQTLSQVAPRLRSVIRNNVGLQILFQCGSEDARMLARELPDGFEAADIQHLSVGEAIVVWRDGGAQIVQFDHPRKASSPQKVEAYRDGVLSRFGPPQPPESAKRTTPQPKAQKPDLGDWL